MKEFNIRTLKALMKRPSLSALASDFWADPYISEHVLDIHLDDELDEGSRKPPRIHTEAAWIIKMWDCGRFPSPVILDLGCGPGFYDAHFMEAGLSVWGMDLSPASVSYARKSLGSHCINESEGRPTVRFELGDFTRLSYPPKLCGATMVYGIFGNLYEKDRDRVLIKLRKALRSGARFIFDMFTESYAHREALKEGWYYSDKNGFWRPDPYLVLEKSWIFEKRRTIFNTYYLLDSEGTLHTRIVRHRWYDLEEVSILLEKHGFRVFATAGDLSGIPFTKESDWFALVAERV